MKSPGFNLVGFVLVLVLPGTISAQPPTAYIPNSPVSGAETALCTPPPGSTCSVPSQTSYVLLATMPSLYHNFFNTPPAQQQHHTSRPPGLPPSVSLLPKSLRFPHSSPLCNPPGPNNPPTPRSRPLSTSPLLRTRSSPLRYWAGIGNILCRASGMLVMRVRELQGLGSSGRKL